MTFRTIFILLSFSLVLSGCISPPVANPKFSSCVNICSNKQSACMLDASSGKQILACKTKQASCVSQCESRFPRYLPR